MKHRSHLLLGLLLAAGTAGPALASYDGDCFVVTGVADNDVLNVRTAPSPDAPIIGRIPAKHHGYIKGYDFECRRDAKTRQTWCPVTYDLDMDESGRFGGEVSGWVNRRFLKLLPELPRVCNYFNPP